MGSHATIRKTVHYARHTKRPLPLISRWLPRSEARFTAASGNNPLPDDETAAAAPNDTTTHFGFRQVAMTEKNRLVKGVFDSVASRYDLMNDLMSGGLHRTWKDEFVKMAGIAAVVGFQSGSQNLQLLDVAGGTGDIAIRLMQEAVKGHTQHPPSITVYDINAEMLAVGQKRVFEQLPDQKVREALTWLEGDAEQLPFERDTFDLYTIAFGLRNVTHRERALSEAYRVLKPGGRFLCLEFSHISLPLAKEAYDVYSFQVIPRLGQLVTGHAEPYHYLVESIRQFPPQAALVKEIQKAGFRGVSFTNYTLGSVAIHSGFKWSQGPGGP